MTSLAIDWPFSPRAADGATVLGLPGERSAKRQLTGSADKIVRPIAAVLRDLLLRVISKRTAAEFRAESVAVFPHYVQLVLHWGKIVGTVVPRDTLVRVANESINELEADIRTQAEQAFGGDIRDRAIFTVWTLRKISDLVEIIAESEKLAKADQERDQEFFNNFLVHALWARFNVDCLALSMRAQQPIYPDALPVVVDGLRSAVNAYAWVKQAVDLRSGTDENTLMHHPAWTEDDQDLVNESMIDLGHEQH